MQRELPPSDPLEALLARGLPKALGVTASALCRGPRDHLAGKRVVGLSEQVFQLPAQLKQPRQALARAAEPLATPADALPRPLP
jgi:hypothetical protein